MSNIAPLGAVVSAPPARRAGRALARVVGWLVLASFGLLLLAWLSLYWAILPHIERWRPQIEAQASAALGVPLRIGSIEARSGGWIPTLELRDVTLLDARRRPALQLSRVLASISARSMLASVGSLEPRLAQLLIEGARLEMRRDSAGRLFVAGMDFSGASAGSESGAADWFFRQREVVIRGASLRWTDELRGAPPLELAAVDLLVRNTLRGHRWRLDATPPPDWGERFSLRGEFTQSLLARSGDWRHWSGQIHVDAPRADASPLRRYLDLPFEWSQGVGAVRAWFEFRAGEPLAFTLDLALRAVALRLGAELEPLVVEQLQGRLSWQRGEQGGRLSLQRLEFVTGDGVRWPRGDLEFAWTRGADGTIGGGELSAGRLDLAVVAHTAARLPIGAALRRVLAQARPRGIASPIRAGWEGSLDAPTRYHVGAKVAGLSIDAQAAAGSAIGRPGLRNAAVDFGADERGGRATLTMKDGALELPGVFEEAAIPLDALEATLRWRIEARAGAAPAVQVQFADVRLSNRDARVALQGSWQTGAGPAPAGRLPGVLDLDGTLTQGVAARTARYLPLGLPEGARHYVQGAVRAGSLTRASFRVRGDLRDFPFRAGATGEFRVAIHADDLTLAYLPGRPPAAGEAPQESPWPPLTRLSGELVIDGASLALHDLHARFRDVELAAPRGGIASVAGKPTLTLELQARGPLADMLHFVDTTPVGNWLGGALRETTASGNGDLALALALPLAAPSHGSFGGSLQLAGNDLSLRHELPLLAAARGRVDFTGKGLTLAGASARVLGGETAIEGGSQPDGSLRFVARGSMSAEAMRRAPELGPLAQLAGALSGQTGYRLSFALRRGLPEVELTSDLVGLGSDLPAPLQKSAAAVLPLHWQTTLAPGASGGPLDTLRFELGSIVKAEFQRDLGGEAPRVLRGGIGILEPAPTPDSGVAASARLDSLDLDAWDAAIGRLFGPGSPAAAGSAGVPAKYMPTQIALRTQELSYAGRRLTRLSGVLSLRDAVWQARLDADQVEGSFEYHPPGATGGGAQGGRVRARLARLSVPRSDVEGVTNLLERQPASVPELDIVIDDLELRGRRLGRVEVQAVNRLVPERAWELTRLKLTVPEARFSATGRWVAADEPSGPRAPAPARRRADIRFELDIDDSGALLERLGTPDAISGGTGRIEGEVAWLGSPLALDFASLRGRLAVAIEKGQFLQAQPGAARLLGVLSLQALTRRLSGDFRDLFQDGFAFDSVTGDVAIAHGVASTNALVMSGAQATVLLEGSADIGRETQDLHVVVVPEINAAAAALAVAVVSPVAGLGTYLAQLALREPLVQANTREFRVTGSWADPQVEAVARGPGQAPPRAGAPPVAGADTPAPAP